MRIALGAVVLACLGAFGLTFPAQAQQHPLLGQIAWVPYDFAPRGWAFCDGQLLSIAQHGALFSVLGTRFGGDGVSTCGLPDLRGRVTLHAGAGPDLTQRLLAETGGQEEVTLSHENMPRHSHSATLRGSGFNGRDPALPGNVLASGGSYSNLPPDADLHPDAIKGGAAGGDAPFGVMQPYITLNCIIALQGIFPGR